MKDKSIFDNIDENLLRKFKQYHNANKHVFQKFKKLAFKMRETGRKKYSAWVIVNKIRWDYDVESNTDTFKINNDFIALYARMLIYNYPEFRPFFELRTMKAYDRRDSQEEQYRRNVITGL